LTGNEEKTVAGVDGVGREVRAISGLPEPAVRREIREAAGLSQARLARALSVSRSCIAQWESGARMVPRGPLLDKYVAALRKLKAEVEADGESRFSTAVSCGPDGRRGDIVRARLDPAVRQAVDTALEHLGRLDSEQMTGTEQALAAAMRQICVAVMHKAADAT
jgi:transcriptional regulator with XRE-family HTH domain